MRQSRYFIGAEDSSLNWLFFKPPLCGAAASAQTKALSALCDEGVSFMRVFLKYTGFAFGIQILLLVLLGLIGNLVSPTVDTLFELFLRIYEPLIVLVAKLGRFKGESAIIEPVWMGTALGVLFYSALLGFAAFRLRRGH